MMSVRMSAPRSQAGFSMIEVLVALVVLAFGLLGFALLQTMSLRFTQSANQRTQATNLAYDLLDQMRANRFQASYYSGSTGASFAPGEVAVDPDDGCARPVSANVTVAQSIERWQCQVVQTLGASASAGVNYVPDDVGGEVTIIISWGDERWDEEAGDATFETVTRL